MLDHDVSGLAGPDFLNHVADAERANGNAINADTYEQRARQWREAERARDVAIDQAATFESERDCALQRVTELEQRIAQSRELLTA